MLSLFFNEPKCHVRNFITISIFFLSISANSQPTCGTTVNTFPYSEGFETGFGNWNNVAGDVFDWTRDSGGTTSGSTGPTTGSGSTWYLYIETSSPRINNDNAWLSSDCFDFTALSAPQFTFDYHMYGATIGTLSLQITTDDVSWTTLWTLSGNQGNVWVTGNNVSLAAYAGQTVRLRFNGVSGTSFTGDIAIDNIAISDQVSMTYTSSTTSQNNTTTVEKCVSDAEVIGIEIVTSGSLSPIDATQFTLRTNGSTNPTVDVANIDVYYTGTSSSFATTTYFGSGTVAAPGINIPVNGTQTLSEGTNYFWVVYDMSASASIGNTIDVLCNSLVVNSSSQTPTVTTPAGNRSIVACVGAPGGISTNLEVWHKADAKAYVDAGVTLATDGDGIQQWNDNAATGVDVTQTTGSAQPTLDEDGINYNPALNFDAVDDFIFATGYSLSGNTTNLIVAAPINDNQNDCLWNISNLGSGWGYNAIYLTTRDGGNRLRFVYRNGPSQSGGNDLDAGTSLPYGEQSLMDFRRTQGGLQESWINTGDYQSISATVGNYSGTSYGFAYGGLGPTTRMFGGKYGEHIKYTAALSNADKNKVDTYLAVKYGITISDNYTATNGAQIYNTSTYANNIIGIGRDDAEALLQKQSHSIDDTTRVYLSTLQTTNVANGGTFTNDISYVVIGDNQGRMCANATINTEIPGTCGLYSRLEREWKVTKTNITEDFNIDVTLNTCGAQGSVTASELRLLVDDDGDFSNGGTTCYFNGDGTGIVISYSNPVITITGIATTHIANNSTKYITIASIQATTPLPVEMTVFDATCNYKTPVLRWTTASETNNAYFTVERSSDAVNYMPVGTLDGNGNSSTPATYNWIDESPLNGTTYYRLKQTDFNGEYNYHGIKTTTCEQTTDISVYPNPFENSFTLQLLGNITYPINVDVQDYLGRKVHSQIIEKNTTKIVLDEALPTGTYFVKVFNESIQVIDRLVKMK